MPIFKKKVVVVIHLKTVVLKVGLVVFSEDVRVIESNNLDLYFYVSDD